MLRCAQEATANVRRHSAAAAVTLRLDNRNDSIRLRVSDDGAGFDPAILHAVEAGASGYLLKDATPDELAHAIQSPRHKIVGNSG